MQSPISTARTLSASAFIPGTSGSRWRWPKRSNANGPRRSSSVVIRRSLGTIGHGKSSLPSALSVIDLAVHGAGEQAFVEILERGRDGRWETLPSVSFLNERDVLVETARSPALKDLTEVPEPYLEGIFDALMAEHPKLDWIGIEETNQNCPFQCTFCGWGRRLEADHAPPGGSAAHDRLVADHRIGYVFVVDSNFGMFKERDIIARYFARLKRERGYPRSVNVQDGKNIEQWVVRVRKELISGGIESPVVLALQSLHPPTLTAIKRSNIKTRAVPRSARTVSPQASIEPTTDIILGLPEETYDSFTDGVSTVIEWGQHNRSLLLNVSMVPDAEMSHPDQRKRYEIDTIWTPLINPHGRMRGREEFPGVCRTHHRDADDAARRVVGPRVRLHDVAAALRQAVADPLRHLPRAGNGGEQRPQGPGRDTKSWSSCSSHLSSTPAASRASPKRATSS